VLGHEKLGGSANYGERRGYAQEDSLPMSFLWHDTIAGWILWRAGTET